jgi:hypothetical protein
MCNLEAKTFRFFFLGRSEVERVVSTCMAMAYPRLLDSVCFFILKIFLKKINIFLMFLDYFDALYKK